MGQMTSPPKLLKRVCVTGATGSIGSLLVQRLIDAGAQVRALARRPDRAQHLYSLDIEVVFGDLSQPDSLRDLLNGCSMIYHTAAKLTGRDRAEFYTVNVRGTSALLEEARRAHVERFVHLSSIAVSGYPHAKNVSENYPWQSTTDPYCSTKQEAERLVWAASDQLPVTIVRPGDVIGHQQRIWTVQLVRLVSAGLLHPPIGDSMLNPVYIDNLLDALLVLGEHPAAIGEVFNVVDGTPVPMHVYIRHLARLSKRRVIPVPPFMLLIIASMLEYQARLRRVEPLVTRTAAEFLLHDTTFSNEKVRKRVGWSPAVGWDEAMRRTAHWLRKEHLIP